MFNVKNGKYLSVKMDWDNITLPLNAGTPVSLDGAIANDDTAIGIVPQTVTVKPIIPEIYILNGGDVDLDEIAASFGDELDEAAIAAMDGIRFWGANGTPVDKPSSGGGLTLYGPYMATVHAATSINANDKSTIALSDLYRIGYESMQLVDTSQITQDTKFFFSGFNCSNKNLSVLGASTPNEMSGHLVTISCANNTEYSISVNIGDIIVALYCSIELPLAESGDDHNIH